MEYTMPRIPTTANLGFVYCSHNNYLVSTHLGTMLLITCLPRSTTVVSAIFLKSRDRPPKNAACALVELLQVTPQMCPSLAGMDSGSVTCSEGENMY